MKKDYMKPMAAVVSVRVNENIANSNGLAPASFEVKYDSTRTYIAGSQHAASKSGDPDFDRFMDLVVTYLYDLDNCRGN